MNKHILYYAIAEFFYLNTKCSHLHAYGIFIRRPRITSKMLN